MSPKGHEYRYSGMQGFYVNHYRNCYHDLGKYPPEPDLGPFGEVVDQSSSEVKRKGLKQAGSQVETECSWERYTQGTLPRTPTNWDLKGLDLGFRI